LGTSKLARDGSKKKRKERKEKYMSTGIENPISPIEAAREIIARLKAIQDALAENGSRK
jgi:hypothetical protein